MAPPRPPISEEDRKKLQAYFESLYGVAEQDLLDPDEITNEPDVINDFVDKMYGYKKEDERKDLIAYLKDATSK